MMACEEGPTMLAHKDGVTPQWRLAARSGISKGWVERATFLKSLVNPLNYYKRSILIL
jgi:hypothetical protein